MLKVNAIYPHAVLARRRVSTAQATSEVGPIRITYDNSPPDGKPGVLVGFMEGDDSRAFYGASLAARRRAALACFARYFGSRALHPIGYVDMAWAEEPFTRGAYGSFNPPGRADLAARPARRTGRAAALRQLRRLAAVARVHGRRDPLRRERGREGDRKSVAVRGSRRSPARLRALATAN